MSPATKAPRALVLIIVGAVIVLGSAVVGFLWLNRTPDLTPVPFADQAVITATRTGTATIFTSTGQATAPRCYVTNQDGMVLLLGEPERYQQYAGMESTYGFATTAGTTYTVFCGSPGESGQFAVAEVSSFPQAAFMAVGSFGLILCAAGGVLAWRQRHAPAVHPA